MKVHGMTDPGRFAVEQIPGTRKSLVRLFQNVEPVQDENFQGFQYDEYHVTVETWDGIAQNVQDNYNAFLAHGIDNEVDRSNIALSHAQKKLAAELKPAAEAAAVAFVLLAEAGQIDAATAGERSALFAPWAAGTAYREGQLRRREGALYQCLQAHTAQEGWEPENVPALWKLTHDPAEEWPAWSQPICAADAYGERDKASHQGKRWTSDLDGNVWEPGVYGWTEFTEE